MRIALILSGGTGSRLGADIPKQYIEVNGSPIISYCIKTLLSSVDMVQVVAAEEYHELIVKCFDSCAKELNNKVRMADGNNFMDKFKGFSLPGDTRQLSIYNGLMDIRKYASENDVVLIHDAARPKLSVDMVNRCFEAIAGHDGVLPVLPMKDTVYISDNKNSVTSLLDRKTVFAGQAPEAFVLGKYIAANEALFPDKIYNINGSTEPAVLSGMDVVMIDGDEDNYKITTAFDLDRFKDEVCKRR